MSLVAFCALFATVGSGCVVPPGSDQFTKPVASSPAGAEPVVLNGAGGKVANPAKGDAKAVAAAPATDGPPAPLLAATPVPQVPATPAVAAVAPDPAGNDANAKNADGFPNINTPPKEPGSKLLPDDERARVISELEALRKKGGSATKDAGGTEVAKKASGKKGTVKCGDGTMAATDADCKATQ